MYELAQTGACCVWWYLSLRGQRGSLCVSGSMESCLVMKSCIRIFSSPKATPLMHCIATERGTFFSFFLVIYLLDGFFRGRTKIEFFLIATFTFYINSLKQYKFKYSYHSHGLHYAFRDTFYYFCCNTFLHLVAPGTVFFSHLTYLIIVMSTVYRHHLPISSPANSHPLLSRENTICPLPGMCLECIEVRGLAHMWSPCLAPYSVLY